MPQRTNRPPSPLWGFGAVRVKRCGKSAPRVRQRKRHGKPHREQDRIGTATRDCSPKGENTAGRCQARRPGRLLEAMCKHGPRGMAVTYRLPQAGGALQNPAYRLADILRRGVFWLSGVPFRPRKHTSPKMRGSAPTRRTPRQFHCLTNDMRFAVGRVAGAVCLAAALPWY